MNTGGRNRRHARGCLKLCFYFRAKGYICKMARLGFVIADPRAGPTIKTNYLTIQDVLFPHGPGCHAATSSSTTIKQIKFTSELILNHLERLGWSQKNHNPLSPAPSQHPLVDSRLPTRRRHLTLSKLKGRIRRLYLGFSVCISEGDTVPLPESIPCQRQPRWWEAGCCHSGWPAGDF